MVSIRTHSNKIPCSTGEITERTDYSGISLSLSLSFSLPLTLTILSLSRSLSFIPLFIPPHSVSISLSFYYQQFHAWDQIVSLIAIRPWALPERTVQSWNVIIFPTEPWMTARRPLAYSCLLISWGTKGQTTARVKGEACLTGRKINHLILLRDTYTLQKHSSM